ncbi:MAG: DUF2817 domain-containing protein [Candidatus Competibacter denitrificans]
MILVGGLLFSFGAYLIIFAPRMVLFSYNGANCVEQLTVLPQLLKADQGRGYQLRVVDTIDIAGYPVIGRKVCATPVTSPKEGRTKVGIAPFGWLMARKTFTIETPKAPLVSVATMNESIPATRSLKIPISSPDTVFDYNLIVGATRTTCDSSERAIECDVAQMKLTQGETYTLKVERQFHEQREVVAQKEVKVLEAVHVKHASVQPDQVIYDKPANFTIQTDKALVGAEVLLERIDGELSHDEQVTVDVADTQITIKPTGELPRDTVYRLTLAHAEGADGSVIAAAYPITFRLSGGPKVTGTSIGAYGVDQNSIVVIQFDQAIGVGQDIARFVHVSGAGAASIVNSGSRVTLRLNAMARCTDFSITVDKGLISEYGITSTNGWSFASRTRCSTISTIGYSVQNRPINAYYFGEGATTMLFTGAIHGNELSSKYLTDALVAYLEEHAREIPSDRRVVVVPTVNPDGVAAKTRYNARNVNLNRNFPTTNWVSDTAVSGGTVEQGAGGSSSLSEPEAAALAAFTQSLQPRLVVTYHSQGSLVNSNDVGIAATLGPQYATMTRYKFVSSEATTGVFGFEMTGTYEDWLAERSTPAILIELPTNTGGYFSQNAAAIWAMIRG